MVCPRLSGSRSVRGPHSRFCTFALPLGNPRPTFRCRLRPSVSGAEKAVSTLVRPRRSRRLSSPLARSNRARGLRRAFLGPELPVDLSDDGFPLGIEIGSSEKSRSRRFVIRSAPCLESWECAERERAVRIRFACTELYCHPSQDGFHGNSGSSRSRHCSASSAETRSRPPLRKTERV